MRASLSVETRRMGVFGAVSMPTWLRVSAPQSPGAARVPATFPRNKVTIRKPVGVMHACYLFTPTDNWQCVYLRKLQLSKDSLCQFAGPLNAMKHKYALKAWNKTMIPIQLITPWTNAGACVSLFPAAANPSLLFPETRLSLHCCWET